MFFHSMALIFVLNKGRSQIVVGERLQSGAPPDLNRIYHHCLILTVLNEVYIPHNFITVFFQKTSSSEGFL